ncbi:hypothetical protein H9P43_003939 [Blastocladiella emersonii ATCC 22665]|nr:hypothetical protein H9P43_003939 [Blastocladiella emersonii ATCC 22665]
MAPPPRCRPLRARAAAAGLALLLLLLALVVTAHGSSSTDSLWTPRKSLVAMARADPQLLRANRGSLEAGELVSKILAASNVSAHRPTVCGDFHESVCRGWRELVKKPDHLTRFGVLAWMRDMHRDAFLSLLQSPRESFRAGDAPSPSLALVHDMYRQCRSGAHPSPRSPFLWSHVARWKRLRLDTPRGLAQAVRESTFLGAHFLYATTVDANNQKSSEMVRWIVQGGLSLANKKSYAVAEQRAHLLALLRSLIADFEIDGAIAEEIVAFEEALARISLDPITLRNPDLPARYHGRSALFPFPNKYPVILNAPPYFRALPALLRATPTRVLRAYFLTAQLQAILPAFEYSPVHTFRDAALHIRRPPRDDYCMTSINNLVPYLAAHVQLRDHYPTVAEMRRVQRDVRLLVLRIQNAYLRLLARNKWMSRTMIARTTRKMRSVRHMIGAEAWILSEAKVMRYYRGYEVQPTWEETLWQFRKLNLGKLDRKLGRPNDRQFTQSPMIVNAFYSQSNNRISIPFGILHPPVYHVDYPFPIKLAGIGMIIAHEFTHALDSRGRHYDWNGNLKDWWEPADCATFSKRSKCYEDQYAQYTVHGLPMNPKLTKAENIADNIAVRLVTSLASSKDYLPTIPVEDPREPGSPLDPGQVFFTYLATVWCVHFDAAAEKASLLKAVHAPSKWRINGSLQNSPEFHTRLACPRTATHPRCTLW